MYDFALPLLACLAFDLALVLSACLIFGVLTMFSLLFLILDYNLDLCATILDYKYFTLNAVIISGLLINLLQMDPYSASVSLHLQPTISAYKTCVHLCVFIALILGIDGPALVCIFPASLHLMKGWRINRECFHETMIQ